MKNQAIDLLALIEAKEAEYGLINNQLHKVQGDFSSNIEVMNQHVHSAVIRLIDTILGDSEIASYYLYDMPSEGGSVMESDGTEYIIRNIEDLRAYVTRN